MRLRALLVLGFASLVSCTYFNGMYNARRLAGDARKAERDGRAFEANRLWGLAATKAESIMAQHPKSKYVPEARLISATALQRSGDCQTAAPMAVSTLASTRDNRVAEDAALLVGRCAEALNDPAAALAAYDRLANSTNQDRRAEAAYRRGRALRMLGRYDDALADLAPSTLPHAQGERAAALMGAGRVSEGLVVVDSMLARHDTAAPWEDIFDLYAGHDPLAASALTMRLAKDSTFNRAGRVAWIVADAERLAPLDPVAAKGLLVVAESLGGGSSVATKQAQITLAVAELGQVHTVPQLNPFVDRLGDIQEQGGPTALQARRLLNSIQTVQGAVDSSLVDRPQADLRYFMAAELARDSLKANDLAGTLLRDILNRWPESPYAPKAALALTLVGTGSDDSLREAVFSRQSASPYLLAIRGEPAPGFQQLEDSLRLFMARYRPTATRGKAPARPGAKPTPRTPRDDQ